MGQTRRGRSLRPRRFTTNNSLASRLRLAVAGLRRGGQSAKGRTHLSELRISEFRVPVRLDDRDLCGASLQLGKKLIDSRPHCQPSRASPSMSLGSRRFHCRSSFLRALFERVLRTAGLPRGPSIGSTLDQRVSGPTRSRYARSRKSIALSFHQALYKRA
jgi:hypothetical protein